MLTQEQLNQLEPLTQHPKYGKLLSDAIEVWKTEINPCEGDFGIDWIDKEKFVCENKCCLLGAALVNKKIIKPDDPTYSKMSQTIKTFFDIDKYQFTSLWFGFDDDDRSVYDEKEAYDFGKKVRKIVL